MHIDVLERSYSNERLTAAVADTLAIPAAFPAPAYTGRPLGLGWQSVLKRAIDVVVSAVAIALLSPLLAILAILICSDRHKMFFAHERIGQNGARFKCLKFRTMVPDADRALKTLLATDAAAAVEWSETQKLRRDPRVTPVGRFLRASSLDELPQLFNILRGEMSLVGPRPIVANEICRYGDKIDLYLSVKPGLTGAWQISGRSDTTYAERVDLDARYVLNWSLLNDISILLRTIPAVAFGRGAI